MGAPVKGGTPPENAFNGLFLLPDGTLRHYGFEGPWQDPSACVFLRSLDQGRTWERGEGGGFGALRCRHGEGTSAGYSPRSGAVIGLQSGRDGTFALRGAEGLDGPFTRTKTDEARVSMLRAPFFLRGRERVLVTGHRVGEDEHGPVLQTQVFLSDDDGLSWRRRDVPLGPRHERVWPHEAVRWQNFAIEPTLAERADGRLWMLLRTSMDRHYESFSDDGGESWSDPAPSAFWGTLTMPTFLRLRDGRLLLFWCNTTPLPEVDRADDPAVRAEAKKGHWEDVFTNRDAIHAAVSEDDGAHWIGLRELYLNPLRNERDFATREGTDASLDRSVHQAQALELPGGQILVAVGQHPLVRAFLRLDPAWLYETRRRDDFSGGLTDWSTFSFLRGVRGHCAYNRLPGAALRPHPDRPGASVLHLARPSLPGLLEERQGALWNFPAGRRGRLTVRLRLQPGGQGGRLCLLDRWINPTDLLAPQYAVYAQELAADGPFADGRWHMLRFAWGDHPGGACRLFVEENAAPETLPQRHPALHGVSYVHFQSAARTVDTAGFLVESVEAETFPHG